MNKLLSLLVFSAFLVSCRQTESTSSSEITADELSAYIKEISGDAYLGRKPFTEGEQKTVAYLEKELKGMGLQPGNGDSYTQDVPLVEITGTPSNTMSIAGNGQELTFKLKKDFVGVTEREQPQIDVQNSEMIFCGFGIVAPEYGWNDYAGLDMKGKTAVVLVNDPGFGGDDPVFFKGDTMTYYGRWTYKFEEAERQGAEAILIVHETTSAGYPWFVVENGWSGAKLRLRNANGNPTKPALQGWLSLDATKQLFTAAGQDLAAQIRKARTKEFTPVSLGLGMSVSLTNTFKEDVSQNVIACVKGSKRPEETIIYTAHWDHFGVGAVVDGDSIYNGAVDNGIGVAMLLSIANAFTSGPVAPERTIVFLFVTAEEQGLLGSAWYAEHPVFPADKTVANLNVDGITPIGATKDLTVIGYGQSDMDTYALEAAKAQGRSVSPDQNPEKGFFFRSDHFNFARIGIPALYAEGGEDHLEKGLEYGRKLEADYIENRYHKPSDEYDESWDLNGIVQDAELFLAVGRKLASETTFPQWNPNSEFRNARK